MPVESSLDIGDRVVTSDSGNIQERNDGESDL
jgi:hypothetical protein